VKGFGHGGAAMLAAASVTATMSMATGTVLTNSAAEPPEPVCEPSRMQLASVDRDGREHVGCRHRSRGGGGGLRLARVR
jgi:hypothetical protein